MRLFSLSCRLFFGKSVSFRSFGSAACFFSLAPFFSGFAFLFGSFGGKAFFLCLAQPCRFNGGCFRRRYCQTDDDEITVGSMVPGDETFLFDPAAHNEFRFHTVGTDGGYPQVFLFAVKGIAVAVHVERKTAAEYAVLVPAHAFQQPGKFLVIVAPRHIEHILLWHETEGVGGVRFLLREDRNNYCRQPQK